MRGGRKGKKENKKKQNMTANWKFGKTDKGRGTSDRQGWEET